MRPRGMPQEEKKPPVDPTGWMLSSVVAEFLLMHTSEIKYMCMFGYTFFHGSKVFSKIGADAPLVYKFVSMILACTGGGILVPIFINSIPVALSIDAYPIAITVSFLLHHFFPVLRQVMDLSPILKATMIVLYETLRASVVVKFTAAAAAAIAPSEFSFPLFGPIFCGTVGGCGGVFLPLNKGLEPLKEGLAPNMMTAFVGATFYHLFVSTSLSAGVVNADKKAALLVAEFFVGYGLVAGLDLVSYVKPKPTTTATSAPAAVVANKILTPKKEE